MVITNPLNIGSQYDVLREIAPTCKKVNFDIASIRKPQKLYSNYKIPRDEALIAFCKSPTGIFGMAINGVVFTDKAFYPWDGSDLKLPSNRIPYTDFGKYIITQNATMHDDVDKGCICLQDTEAQHPVYSDRILFKNTAGIEIRMILETIQTAACKAYPNTKADFESFTTWIFESAREQVRSGSLSDRFRHILVSLMRKQEYCDQAAELIAKSYFRLRDDNRFQKFIDDLPDTISVQMRTHLQNAQAQFTNELISDLSNLSIEFSDDYLKFTASHLDTGSPLPKQDLKIAAYVAARRKRFDLARTFSQEFNSRFGNNAAHDIENFICVYGNRLMKQAFEMLQVNEELPEEWLYLTDGLNLTPLHYAIILNNSEQLQSVLWAHDWCEPMNYLPTDQLESIYAYSTLACLKHDEKLLQTVCIHTNRNIKEMVDERFALKEQLPELEHAYFSCCKESDNGRIVYSRAQGRSNQNDLDELRQNIDSLEEQERELFQSMEMTKDRIKALEKEIPRLVRSAVYQAEETLAQIKDDRNPLLQLLFRIYENCDEFENLAQLLDEGHKDVTQRMYLISGFYVLLPERIVLNAPYREVYIHDGVISDNTLETNDSFSDMDTSHGANGSWFSDKAHTDETLLKEEYRELAKKYHPDISKVENAKEIFQSIAAEYDELMRHIM